MTYQPGGNPSQRAREVQALFRSGRVKRARVAYLGAREKRRREERERRR